MCFGNKVLPQDWMDVMGTQQKDQFHWFRLIFFFFIFYQISGLNFAPQMQ